MPSYFSVCHTEPKKTFDDLARIPRTEFISEDRTTVYKSIKIHYKRRKKWSWKKRP